MININFIKSKEILSKTRFQDCFLLFSIVFFNAIYFISYNFNQITFDGVYTVLFVCSAVFLFSVAVYLLLLKVFILFGIKDFNAVVLIGTFLIVFLNYGELINNIDDLYKAALLYKSDLQKYEKLYYLFSVTKIYILLIITLLLMFLFFKHLSYIRVFYIKIFSIVFIMQLAYIIFLLVGNIRNDTLNSSATVDSNPETVWENSVYIILVDGYPRYDSALKNLVFDNSEVLDFLKSKGFEVIEKSTSNYPITFLSMHSFLTSSYPYNEETPKYYRSEAYNYFGGNNPIAESFLKQGYTYIHIGSGAWEGSKCQNKAAYCHYKQLPFDLSYETLDLIIKKTPLAEHIDLLDGVIVTISDIQNLLETKFNNTEKIFLFAHTLPPHAPFIFKANCERKRCFTGKNLGSSQTSKSDFIDNMQCVNLQMKNFVNFMESKDPNAIIIFLSDHGTDFSVDWNKRPDMWDNNAIEERFANFIAIKTPKNKEYLYPTISLVNVIPFLRSVLDNTKPIYSTDDSYITVYENLNVEKRFIKVKNIEAQ